MISPLNILRLPPKVCQLFVRRSRKLLEFREDNKTSQNLQTLLPPDVVMSIFKCKNEGIFSCLLMKLIILPALLSNTSDILHNTNVNSPINIKSRCLFTFLVTAWAHETQSKVYHWPHSEVSKSASVFIFYYMQIKEINTKSWHKKVRVIAYLGKVKTVITMNWVRGVCGNKKTSLTNIWPRFANPHWKQTFVWSLNVSQIPYNSLSGNLLRECFP